MADAGVHKELWSAVKAQFPGARLTSAYRSGSITATGNLSYHARGMAIDIAGPEMPKYFEWIKANYPNSKEIIYSPAGSRQVWNGKEHLYSEPTKSDHYDHVHWAATSLGEAAQGGSGGSAPVSGSGSATADNPLIPDEMEALYSFYQFVSDPKMWLRVGIAIGGGILLIIVFLAMSKNRVKLPKGIKGLASSGN